MKCTTFALIQKNDTIIAGGYVDTVGKNTKAIKTYISEQLKKDRESDQLSLFDPRAPFMGK